MPQVKNKIQRILVVKPSSLGDIVHVFPALELLRQKFPDAELDFLVHPAFADILDFSPFPVAHKILFDRKHLSKLTTFAPKFLHLVRELRQRRYDLIIDFQGLIRSAIFAKIAKGCPVIGFAHPREALATLGYNLKFNVPAGHAVERNVNLVNAFLSSHDAVPKLNLPQDRENIAKLQTLIDPMPEELIALLPGSRWPSKCFPPRLFADVIGKIHAQQPQCVFVIVGAKSDSSVAKTICEIAGSGIPLLDLSGKTSLGVMAELLRKARVVISNDSGPMHVAAALQKPVFGFFGPTDPDKTGPFGGFHHIYRNPVKCLGCLKRNCPLSVVECHKLDSTQIANDVTQTL
jgi:lipopolysaccharide heptosyltransferase I